MIRPNNPEIDVDALMGRVRADAERIRNGAVPDIPDDGRTPADDPRASAARYAVISALIREAERKNEPRRALPQQFRFIGSDSAARARGAARLELSV
jgi:hypothetical protein